MTRRQKQEKMRDLWENGANIPQIAKAMGVKEGTVKVYLNAMGLSWATRVKPSKNELHSLACDMTAQELAEKYDVTMQTMYKWLREYELRAKKPPSWKGTRQKKTVNVPFCVRQILTGGNLTEIARESGVSTSTIYYRIKQAGYNLDELKELYQANHGQHKNCIYSSKTMKSCKYGGECCYYLVVTGKRRPCPADDCFVYEKGSRRNERKRKLY
ncbi:MAG: hypothetical protein J6T99_07035 [Oscillospiraceae bacterium]|nr:hypothetical protein [Oscillospiraceae bacterium]